jgi:putative ABC transport system ATP-binding protein
MNRTLVETRGLVKVFSLDAKKVSAIDGIDQAITTGEFVSIIGPSGSGKTTLLNLIGCIDYPTSGKVLFNGRDISTLSEEALDNLRLHSMGFIFQTFNLLPNFTALENVVLPMAIAGIKDEERMKRAKELLESVGLTERLYHKPRELSAGESQRVAIARALANKPFLLLADEPTGNLDSKTTTEISDLLRKLKEEHGVAIILVTHDTQVAQIADRTLHMVDGHLDS